MAIGIDPKVDFAFKLLLGSPEHPTITLHFLNTILNPSIEIVEVEILNPILGKLDDGDKLSILDVAARDASGRLYDIEMQTSLPAGLPQRLAYYTASMYVGQIGEGDDYTRLRPAISICVLDAILIRDSRVIHSEFRLRSRDGRVDLTDGLQIHLLELPKYEPPSDNQVIDDPVEAWLCFLRRADQMTSEEIHAQFKHPAFSEAAKVLEMIQRTPDQRSQYELRLKAQRDEQARLQYAIEQGRREGEAKGKEEGEIRGKLIGQIMALAGLLGQDTGPFHGVDINSLEAKLRELREELRDRGLS
ncbi:MAG: Rpn family recombination-promoting nuclease/putative transposase [Planctomycetota bacterium]